MEIEIQDKN